jgi:hypothetical protein
MEDNIENIDSINGENDQAILDTDNQVVIPEGEDDTDDAAVLKERLAQLDNANKQLFARAKKAEGFTLQDGKWVKKPVTPTQVTVKPVTSATKNDEDVDTRISKGIMSALDQRDLEALDLTDEVKAEVSNLAKMKGITVKAALSTPYIKFLKEQDEMKNNAEIGSMPSGRKGTFTNNGKVQAFDPRTEEGKKAAQKRDEELRKKLG